MRTAPALLLALATLAVAAVPASAASSCGSLPDVGPTGADPADALAIRATVTSCKTARKIIPRAIKAQVQSTSPRYRVGIYRCRDSISASGRFSYRCTARGGRVVTWRLG